MSEQEKARIAELETLAECRMLGMERRDDVIRALWSQVDWAEGIGSAIIKHLQSRKEKP